MKYFRARNMAFAAVLFFVSLIYQAGTAQSPIAESELTSKSGSRAKIAPTGTGKEGELQKQTVESRTEQPLKLRPALPLPKTEPGADPGHASKPKSKTTGVWANETNKVSPKKTIEPRAEQAPKRRPALVEPEAEPDYHPQQQVKTGPAEARKETKLQTKPTAEARVEQIPKRRPALKRTVSTDAELDPSYVKPTIEYDEIIDPSKRRAISATIGSEFALRSDRVERAIQLARRSIKKYPDDMDAHKALAEALDRKLELQVDKDPTLFEECIKEWLVVMRNGVGFEKGTNWRGIGILDHLYGDDEFYELARHRIKHLTGYMPKPWESNARFLKKVMRPAKTELQGKILKKPAEDE